jgi:hypothetical protein
MATLQQLERAFLKAHEAGDTENAQILADELRRLMAPPTVDFLQAWVNPAQQKKPSVIVNVRVK